MYICSRNSICVIYISTLMFVWVVKIANFLVPHQADGNVSTNVIRSVCYGLGYGLWRAFTTTVSSIVSRFRVYER